MSKAQQLWTIESVFNAQSWQQLIDARSSLSDMPEGWLEQWQTVWLPLAAHLADYRKQFAEAPVIGIHGGQGSGKSTLSKALATLYKKAFNWNVVTVSIDDLYLTYQERQDLSKQIHPLLCTRGVPGTHDAAFGMELFKKLKALKQGESVSFASFDKISDDRLPEEKWHQVSEPVDMILFEGWCVGCQPVVDDELVMPVNELETNEDEDGTWRCWVNDQLEGIYHDWFAMIDYLIMLKVPDMSAVQRWRAQQEEENRHNTQGTEDRSLDQAALARFIQHYERLTREALKTLPETANLVLHINQAHQVSEITARQTE